MLFPLADDSDAGFPLVHIFQHPSLKITLTLTHSETRSHSVRNLFAHSAGATDAASSIGNTSSTSRALLYVALTVVMIWLADAAFVFYLFSQNQFKQFWTLRLLRHISCA